MVLTTRGQVVGLRFTGIGSSRPLPLFAAGPRVDVEEAWL